MWKDNHTDATIQSGVRLVTELAVITPCFRGDVGLFRDLHRSVLEFTSEDTVHHVLVPSWDKHLFTEYEGPRCRVWVRSEILPRRYVRVPSKNMFVNLRRPWPPLRGWVMQQTAKIAAAAQIDADFVLVADSDVVLVRPTSVDRFIADGQLCLYRIDNGVSEQMQRHVIWHQVARKLLGLPPPPPPPLPDFIAPLNFWDPAIVRAMQERVTEVTGQSWLDAFNAQRHVSEFILYGVFVEEVLSVNVPRPPVDNTIVHSYYERVPLDHDSAMAFADKLPADAIGMMISAKSNTPMDVRQAAIARSADVVRAD
jgi:hypothetical protein